MVLCKVVIFFVFVVWGVSSAPSLDCRKFVFAPACRGATVKRSMSIEPKKYFHDLNDEGNTEQIYDTSDITYEDIPMENMDNGRVVVLKKSLMPLVEEQRLVPLLLIRPTSKHSPGILELFRINP